MDNLVFCIKKQCKFEIYPHNRVENCMQKFKNNLLLKVILKVIKITIIEFCFKIDRNHSVVFNFLIYIILHGFCLHSKNETDFN